MIFTALEVENIFAYEGNSRIDLTGCTADRNIVLVSGKNGAGKTSLLNAIKFLFLGSDTEEIRRVGIGNAPLNQKPFVLGQKGRWFGVINDNAREPGSTAFVALEWIEGARRYRAQRTVRRAETPLGFDERLTVTVDALQLSASESRALVDAMAPKEVVPFFFFDGELIQSFADAEEGRDRAEIERLLGFAFVNQLAETVNGYMLERRRSGMPDTVLIKIREAEGQRAVAHTKADGARRTRIQLEDEVLDLEREAREIDRERDGLRIGITEADRQRMQGRIAFLREHIAQLANQIAATLPPEAPWLTNLSGVRAAFEVLEKHLRSGTDATLAGRLHSELPMSLIRRLSAQVPPVVLLKSQQEKFRSDIAEELDGIGVPANASSNPLLRSLSPRKIQTLRDQFFTWSERGDRLADAQAELLRQMRLSTNELLQAQGALDEAELTTDEARLQFEDLTQQLETLNRTLRERRDEVSTQRIEEQRAHRLMEDALNEIRRLEGEHSNVLRDNKEYILGGKVRRALDDYRNWRRREIRASVEDRLNEHIGVLLGPSELIKSVTLSDKFHMQYFDASNEEVARRSISAGMRQLAAMAMLWALKDEARRQLPVVIDTPLGRIDRANRALLMSEYFPKAGNPLILLPTDSELDSNALASLDDRIIRQYIIKNDGGKRAKITSDPRSRSAEVAS